MIITFFNPHCNTVESEIPSPGNPLLRLSPEARRRVLFSPHLAGVTRAAFARLIRQAIGNLENSLRGLPPQFSVNGLSSIRPSAGGTPA